MAEGHSEAAQRAVHASSSEGAAFSTILPRLVSAYERGRLVPFVGAGMSVPACRLWEPFIDELEKQAGGESPAAGNKRPDALIMRANRAVGRLRALGPATLAARVRSALYVDNPQCPPQTAALCRLPWPMLFTTNYDDCVFTAFRERHKRDMVVCGRGADDAQYVLNALYEPADPVLWTLQGYLGGPFGKPDDRLAGEIVVGHEEYRKVAHAEPQFRRAFAEVFRSRSMLFLGSGLEEPYFREMFSEIFEIYGPCVRPHYAFVKKGDLDIQFMATRFQLIVLEYADHPVVENWLNQLADAVAGPVFRQHVYSFALREPRPAACGEQPCPRLALAHEPLAGPSGPSGCIAVSAGGSEGYAYSPKIRQLLGALGVAGKEAARSPVAKFVARLGDSPVYAVRAREKGDVKSLRVVREASDELFDNAWEDGFRRIAMQLLASGGSENAAASYDLRPFSPLFALVGTVREFGKWCRAHPDRELDLTIHVLDESAWFEVASGRLDIDELLSNVDLRFWAKAVYPDGRIQRQMCQELEDVSIGGLARWIGLEPEQWFVESIPHIGGPFEARKRAVSTIRKEPLSSCVIPGGTLRFTTSG